MAFARNLLNILLVGVYVGLVPGCGSTTQATASFRELKANVERAAGPALQEWLDGFDVASIADYGFRSREELSRATPGAAIPLLYPSPPEGKPFSQSAIEQGLLATPTSWFVPVTVGDRIACAMTFETVPGKKPESARFGMTYAANRLAAGLNALDWRENSRWERLRLLKMTGPMTDLLLYQLSDGTWEWVRLTGTLPGEASILTDTQIAVLLERLSTESEDAF